MQPMGDSTSVRCQAMPTTTANGCPVGSQIGNDILDTRDFLDADSFTTLGLAGSSAYGVSSQSPINWQQPLDYILNFMQSGNSFTQDVTADSLSFAGFGLVPAPPMTGVAWEFTGQVVETCDYVDLLLNTTTFQSCAQSYLNQILQAANSAPFGDGIGVVASTLQNGDTLPPVAQCLQTPYQCIPERVGLAATNWAIFANEGFNPISFPALTVSESGTGTGTIASSDGFINCGTVCSYSYFSGTQVTLTATPAQGSSFTSWSGCDSSNGNSCTVAMVNSRTVSAVFTQNSIYYTLGVSTSGNGRVTSADGYVNCPGTCSHSYLQNSQVTLTATAAQGWAFFGWSGACGGTGPCNVTMTQPQSVGATFTQLSFFLTVSKAGTGLGTVTSTPAGINCGATCSASYSSGTQVTLTATPTQGSSFTSWSGCDSTQSNICTITMNNSRTVTAIFTLQAGYYTLSVSTSGGGTVSSTDGLINCPGSCSYAYLSNTPVTLNATPSLGWTFVGWSGACSGTGPCNVTMTQSLSVGAAFIFGVAVYNSILGAPECGSFGRSCDSGPWLLLGKDNMIGGAEPNQPNTIHGSCADGTAGTFHVDESNDRLVVVSTNGRIMSQGSIVRVSATVWVASTTQDRLDLYYATSANNPTWVYIGTLVPRASGLQTLSTLFRLRPGSLQAVRANFRKGGTRSPCSTGNFDDHDDLAFAVR